MAFLGFGKDFLAFNVFFGGIFHVSREKFFDCELSEPYLSELQDMTGQKTMLEKSP